MKKYDNLLSYYKIIIIGEVSLDASDYYIFSNNLLNEYTFLSKYNKSSYFDENKALCLKINCEDNTSKYPILVVLEGNCYEKYSTILDFNIFN